MHVIGTNDIVEVKPVSDISTTPAVDFAAEAIVQNEFSGWKKNAIFDLSIGTGEFWQQISEASIQKTLSRPEAILYGYKGQINLAVVGMSRTVTVKQLTNENGAVDDPTTPVEGDTVPEPEPGDPPVGSVPSTAFIVNNNIEGRFEGFGNGALFKLRNGQVWEQTSFDITVNLSLSPEAIIYSDSYDYKLFVKGVNRIVSVKPLTDISSSSTIQTYINSFVTSDFRGFTNGAIFELGYGPLSIWEQTSLTYRYHYAHNPQAIVFGSPGGYKMLIPSIGEYVSVEPL